MKILSRILAPSKKTTTSAPSVMVWILDVFLCWINLILFICSSNRSSQSSTVTWSASCRGKCPLNRWSWLGYHSSVNVQPFPFNRTSVLCRPSMSISLPHRKHKHATRADTSCRTSRRLKVCSLSLVLVGKSKSVSNYLRTVPFKLHLTTLLCSPTHRQRQFSQASHCGDTACIMVSESTLQCFLPFLD